MLGAGAQGRPRGMEWGGRRKEGSGWGTHVYLWQIHFDIWQNQYNIIKFKNKTKLKKNTNQIISRQDYHLTQCCTSEEKHTNKQTKLSTNLTLYKVYTNHWTNFQSQSQSEVAQSCPTLCDPMDTRLLRPWDFLGKSTGVGCHCFRVSYI